MMDDNSDLKSHLLEKMLNFLSFRPRTEKELHDRFSQYLYKKKLPEGESLVLEDYVFTRLSDLGYINDLEYVRAFLRPYVTSGKVKSKKMLFNTLMKKGLNKDIILSELENISEDNQLKAAKACFEKKLRSLKKGTSREKAQKLKSFLYQKGYSSDIISAIFDIYPDIK